MTESANETSDEYWGTVELSETDRHRLLASESRQAVFTLLEERALPMELDEMATTLAENRSEMDTAKSDSVERIALQLHHNHLPKMDDFGVIDYNPTTGRVEAARKPAEL